ncbi:MAG: TRAP transporter large permease subunit, partial [Proteobacteria bacterium]|nr:TRAP transporter large permease subunit [Pseudomonadota bacterium]
SVVKLYAGAFFPGIMLATLYVGYIIIVAKLKPNLAPPLSEEDRVVVLPKYAETISRSFGNNVLRGLAASLKGNLKLDVPNRTLITQLFIALLPALVFTIAMGLTYRAVTAPPVTISADVVEMGTGFTSEDTKEESGGLQEPEQEGGLKEPPAEGLQVPPGTETAKKPEAAVAKAVTAPAPDTPAAERVPAPMSYWITFAIGAAALVFFYAIFTFARLEIFKMLLESGSLGGLILAAAYRRFNMGMLRESVYLTAKTSAMVCWLFVGSSIFSAAFALLGGQEIINQWVLSLDMTPVQFMILAQIIIFLLGWPLEWTEIIVIFMPIFIPLLPHFNIDPLFFGLLVALNLQTAFLSPPVAMAAFYLKGVSSPHVTLNQIFLGMMPFMAIQVVALVLLYVFPGIGLWLPSILYK